MNNDNKNHKVYVVGGSINYANWLIPIGFEITNKINEANLIFFTGGEDVSPEIYGQPPGSHTYSSSERDYKEIEIYTKYPHVNKIGVCRGGQFLTVMNGYQLVQHSSHPSWHNVTTFDGQILLASSTHHQQFLLQKSNRFQASNVNLIGWAENLSPFHLDGKDKNIPILKDYREPEIVVYDNNLSKSLAIQMHVEFFDLDHETVKYMQNLVKTHLI